MAKTLTKILYIKLLRDVKNFLRTHQAQTINKPFVKMLDELSFIVSQSEQDTSTWRSFSPSLLEKLKQIYQSIPHGRWFHAYGMGLALRDDLEQIFQNTLGIQPEIGYFGVHLMPMGNMDIAIGRYVKSNI